VLIVAGSDSGGGAGIQADIKTVTVLGGHAMTAVTALTAQNTLGVTGVFPVPADFVIEQIDAVLADLGADAVKIGMIGSPETAHAVADRLQAMGDVPIVFDPVMIASSGSALADDETIAAFERLMRIATVTTPNVPELQRLAGAAGAEGPGALVERHGCAVLAKGGDAPGDQVADLLVAPDGETTSWTEARIETRHTHGTGCTLASAIAVHLGYGRSLADAVGRARGFVRRALLAAPGFGGGAGPLGHAQAGTDAMNLDQVTLPATDYAASVAFYRTLGLRQIADSAGRYARFECPGGSTLSIHVEEGLQVGDATIGFDSPDLDAWVERLLAAGVEFTALPQDRPWKMREAFLRDPAGNRIMLFRGGEYRRHPPGRTG
jgi:hydroxymethylpyrimidine/phosphomethylpyrimidine kinase